MFAKTRGYATEARTVSGIYILLGVWLIAFDVCVATGLARIV